METRVEIGTAAFEYSFANGLPISSLLLPTEEYLELLASDFALQNPQSGLDEDHCLPGLI
jgi:hypothetical protein